MGEKAGVPCPRHHASTWKVELTPGGMPRAQGVGICWHGILGRTRGPTTARHSGPPLARHRVGPLLPRRALSLGALQCPLGAMPTTYRGPSHWHRAAHGRAQTLCWTPARLRMALPAGWRPQTGHLWVWAHGPISSLSRRRLPSLPCCPQTSYPATVQTRTVPEACAK